MRMHLCFGLSIHPLLFVFSPVLTADAAACCACLDVTSCMLLKEDTTACFFRVLKCEHCSSCSLLQYGRSTPGIVMLADRQVVSSRSAGQKPPRLRTQLNTASCVNSSYVNSC